MVVFAPITQVALSFSRSTSQQRLNCSSLSFLPLLDSFTNPSSFAAVGANLITIIGDVQMERLCGDMKGNRIADRSRDSGLFFILPSEYSSAFTVASLSPLFVT